MKNQSTWDSLSQRARDSLVDAGRFHADGRTNSGAADSLRRPDPDTQCPSCGDPVAERGPCRACAAGEE